MFDVLVLAIGENKNRATVLSENIIVETINSDIFAKKKYFHSIWPFFNNLPGIVYKFSVDDEFGKLGCGDGLLDFCLVEEEKITPYLLREKSEELAYDFTSLKLKDEFRQAFKKLLLRLIENSSINTILFLCGCQSNDTEIIQGSLTLSDFVDLFSQGRVFSNICYIISK